MLANCLSAIQSSNKVGFLSSLLSLACKVVMKVVKHADYDIVAITQAYQHVFWLWEESIVCIGYDHHLRLLKSAAKVEEVKIFVVGKETNTCPVSSWHRAFFDDSFNCRSSLE